MRIYLVAESLIGTRLSGGFYFFLLWAKVLYVSIYLPFLAKVLYVFIYLPFLAEVLYVFIYLPSFSGILMFLFIAPFLVEFNFLSLIQFWRRFYFLILSRWCFTVFFICVVLCSKRRKILFWLRLACGFISVGFALRLKNKTIYFVIFYAKMVDNRERI